MRKDQFFLLPKRKTPRTRVRRVSRCWARVLVDDELVFGSAAADVDHRGPEGLRVQNLVDCIGRYDHDATRGHVVRLPVDPDGHRAVEHGVDLGADAVVVTILLRAVGEHGDFEGGRASARDDDRASPVLAAVVAPHRLGGLALSSGEQADHGQLAGTAATVHEVRILVDRNGEHNQGLHQTSFGRAELRDATLQTLIFWLNSQEYIDKRLIFCYSARFCFGRKTPTRRMTRWSSQRRRVPKIRAHAHFRSTRIRTSSAACRCCRIRA